MLLRAYDGFESGWTATAAVVGVIQASILALLLIPSFAIAGSAPALAPSLELERGSAPVAATGAETPVDFNIPAQPLARALVAYGAATGLEVFYNAALAERQRSAEVIGILTPAFALQILLRGTGYVARSTGPGAFTIAPGPGEPAPASVVPDAVRRSYEPYFATIQTQIGDILCRSADIASRRDEIVFRIWLTPSGMITRAEVVGNDGTLAEDQTFAAAMRGLAMGVPPAGMPEPVNLVIFPSSNTSRACRSGGG